ncbi:MAG: NUDIX domain-containing protein [Pseudolabrys sp.]
MQPPTVTAVDQLDLTFDPRPWPLADARRAEIDAHFAALQRDKPGVWNGRVLLMHEHRFEAGILRGRYLETDYASFTAWRAWGGGAADVHDCFGAAAIVAADGAVLLGVMGAHTANAGWIYFPAGTPDPSDIIDGRVDLDFSVRRELKEETGCDAADFTAAPGWTMVTDGGLMALIKILRSAESAETLRERVLAHLANEEEPELSDIRIVRGPADFDLAMPRFVTAFLRYHFKGL